MSDKTLHCINHCGKCGSHFRSLAAFDAHRQGSHKDGTRRCIKPRLVDTLVAVTTDGVCDVYGDVNRRVKVTIWTTAADSPSED